MFRTILSVCLLIGFFLFSAFALSAKDSPNTKSNVSVAVSDKTFIGLQARGGNQYQSNSLLTPAERNQNGYTILVRFLSAADHGAVRMNGLDDNDGPNGGWNYRPQDSYTGDATFTYTACAVSTNDCATGTVTLVKPNSALCES
jgi:hypothetical protein